MLHDYLNVIVLFLVVSMGFILAKVKWLDHSSNTLFTKLLLNISLPSTIILSIKEYYTRHEFIALLPSIILPVMVIFSLMAISLMIAKILKVEKENTGLFIGLCSMSSTIFFGIPVTIAVYGYHGLPYALMTYASQTVIYWTLGLYLLEKERFSHETLKNKTIHIVKDILNMPLIAFFVGVCLLLSGIKMPLFLHEFFSYLSGMTSALAMMVVGSIIFISGVRRIKINIRHLFVILFRFIFAPITVLFWGYLFSIDREMVKITILICSLPIPNTTVILAEKYGLNTQFATETLSLTIGAYLIFLPIILSVIHAI